MAYRLAQPDSRLARNAADVLGGLRHLKAVEPLGAALHNPVFDVEARVGHGAGAGPHRRAGSGAGPGGGAVGERAPVRAAALQALRELRGPLDPGRPPRCWATPIEDVRVEAAYTVAVAIARMGRTPDADGRDQATAALIAAPGRRSQRQRPPQGGLGAGRDRRPGGAGRPARCAVGRARRGPVCTHAGPGRHRPPDSLVAPPNPSFTIGPC